MNDPRAYSASTPPQKPVLQESEVLRPFPTEALFDFAPFVREVARVERVPDALPSCAVLAIASASIGKGLQIASDAGDRKTRGLLYVIVSAESGTGKGNTYRHAMAPFNTFEGELIRRWAESDRQSLESEKRRCEARAKLLERKLGHAPEDEGTNQLQTEHRRICGRLQDLETLLTPPVLQVEDVTTERLATLLKARQECLFSVSEDAGNIINNVLGRHNKLDRTDETLYLKCWSGTRERVDRQTRGGVILDEPCLSALWFCQPDKLETLMDTRGLTDGGLMPRFLICEVRAPLREIERGSTGVDPNTKDAYHQRIRQLLESYRVAGRHHLLRPDDDVLDRLNAYFNDIVRRRRADPLDHGKYSARWCEQAWRISVVLHAIRYGNHAHEHVVDLQTANAAIDIATWFSEQQLEVLSVARTMEVDRKWERVRDLFREKPGGITATDLCRRRIVLHADKAKALLRQLHEDGKLLCSERTPPGGGHTTHLYTLPTHK